MNLEFWIENSGSFMHQIFMIVMGALYALSFILGVSYKAVNIYMYFVFFPLSFSSFFLRGWKKLLFIPVSFLFFMIPNFESLSNQFFDLCVVFLNDSAEVFNSDYIRMSVYLCVAVPIAMYIFANLFRYGFKRFLIATSILTVFTLGYYLTVYQVFEPLVNTYFLS
jgi:hypothetical protein